MGWRTLGNFGGTLVEELQRVSRLFVWEFGGGEMGLSILSGVEALSDVSDREHMLLLERSFTCFTIINHW